MLTPPTADQVRTLAPDAAAARAGEELAGPNRWSSTGRSDAAAWGLCLGSGSTPYQVAVDLSGPAYRCSCPSRKIPCKHGLALLFVLSGGTVAVAAPPDWVSGWLEGRAARAAASATRADRVAEVDPAARAKRVESREKKVAAGIDELDRWLGDLIRRGLDSTRSDGYRFWDAMGARLVDAQAASLGRAVRMLGSAANAGEAWPHLLLEGTARLHLLCEAYRRADGLPDGLRADVRALVGWTTKEEDLDPRPAVADRWLVVGRQVDDAGQVFTARTWLLGETSGRFALHLAFGVEAAPPTVLALPGQAFRATVAFYPSATPLRAAVRPVLVPDGDVTQLPTGSSIPDLLASHARRLAANPFVGGWPVLLDAVVPVLRDDALLVRHADGVALPVAPTSVGPRLLAISGGRGISLVGEWDGIVLRAISAFGDGRVIDLDAAQITPLPIRGDATMWPQLVSAALIGTERAGDVVVAQDDAAELVSSIPTGDPEGRLLALAGIVALRRRAGSRPSTDEGALPDPAALDPRPALVGILARFLGSVLAEHRELLAECLALVRGSGRRVPEERLPELLGLAGTNMEFREIVTDLGGPRAAWLAALIPRLRDGVAPRATGSPDEAWEAASGPKQRALALRSIRAQDPRKGRQLLDARLGEIAGDERTALVEAMEVGLSPADESLLERALGDRRADVRRAAADLLSRLEGSAFARRLADRARPLLASQGMLRTSLAVTLPTADAELEAAGLAGTPPRGIGERAWLLRQVLGHIPPRRWTEWLRADPGGLIERALRTDEARPLLEGWVDATGRFGDRAWAAALLSDPKVRPAIEGVALVRVLDGLSPDTAAQVVATAARHLDQTSLARMSERCATPWPRPLADAVFAVLGTSAGADNPDYAWYALVRAAAAAVSPDRVRDLEALASHRGAIRPSLVATIDMIRFRSQMYAAFADLPPA